MNSTENKNFVISISTAEQRRNHIIEQFTHQNIPFEFFDAFTPSDKLTDHLQRYLPNVANAAQLTMGEKGCLMSHFMLWKKCIDENLDYVTLFEDDILLGENANKFLAEDEWLKVRFNFQEIFVLRLETFLMPVQLEKQAQIPPFQQRDIDILTSKHFGTAGYVISQGAAKYLIALFEKLTTEEIKPIDEIMFNQQINATDYRVYQLNPAICVQELQLNQEASLLVSNLEQERKNKPKIRKKKTLKQRLSRIKENIIRAINKEKWKEQQRIREILGKEIVRFM
ncbi:Lipooligosaccharide biosynthesis protein lex-1 [Aggregatibacter actinomycetemcomitans]|uniref:glycosyltransferase family 25 protein n=2 Tax=Aggregatibacter actinomycetemcomitans TaxID=714 RepID=UPI0001B9F85D|nr:glycosyltransferase family 25 protein [Aggregatibacter actinomycetemcomitans]ACX81839.1 lipooligosaccharide biosynthesis protein lex-1 [Aggregatibacter actinomycetemcomitans D11S-1]KOE59135.1 lipooligosaccharide biosynthesis protein lex-1 [Aggregatibacter actinomycetemcomitans serotype c str. D17P-2]KOE59457.1 lipooligosaccharide biosynthesis protein lex-1 [Aggregatibacter actinomycetemcomitans serotype c str. AAS4A]KOE61215.1 lipooligosaccharide biosynthesis protein lex-1 [Aggregatibacter a